MKATYCAGWVLTGLLAVFQAGGAFAAQLQPAEASDPSIKPHAVKPSAPPATTEHKASVKKRAPMASKSKSAREIAQKRLPAVKLDLSLPPEMVKQLQPLGTIPMPRHKPLLPNMFGEKPAVDSPFQLNGRLLSNEMNLQLRNEGRQQEIEGAALDFEFKQ